MTAPLPPDLTAMLAARPELASLRLRHFPVLSSTSDLAAELAASGAVDGTTVVADAQTSGRGRRGRSWHSPPETGLYLSTVCRGRPSPLITLMAGVAVAESVRAVTGLGVDLKWPNDVVIGSAGPDGASGRKIAGILTEALPPGVGDGVVVGIGVNVGAAAFPPELTGRATALETEIGHPVDRVVLLGELLSRLSRGRAQLDAGGEDPLIARWRELSPTSRGISVVWNGPDVRYRGLTAGIDNSGALLVECEGRTERIVGGEIEWP